MPLVVVDTSQPPGGDWLDPEDLAGCATAEVDLEQLATATADLMFALSGQRFGTLTETVRPYRMGETCTCGPAPLSEVSFSWTTHSAWSRAASCACGGPSVVRLAAPVAGIASVTVDGETLAFDTDFLLYDQQWLVRVGTSWPCCQDLTRTAGEDRTFAITYSHGDAVPAAGQVAARLLGCELAKAVAGEECALTGAIQSVTREGVSAVLVVDPLSFAHGRTGIPGVDLWLSTLPQGGGTITRPFAGPRGLVRPNSL